MPLNPVVIETADPKGDAQKWLDARKKELATQQRQRRFHCEEVRLVHGDGPPKITGYAAVFNQETELWPGFRESVAPGAFAKSLKEDDVRALFNHDVNYILGRTKAKTLSLWEDKKGLGYNIIPPDTSVAADLMVSIKRGDVDQSSFGFDIVSKNIKVDRENDEMTRTILEAKLYDVSPVTFPAYPQTEVKVRMFRNDKDCVFCLEDSNDVIEVSNPIKVSKPTSDEELFKAFEDLKKRAF
jgi:hypothetical protein